MNRLFILLFFFSCEANTNEIISRFIYSAPTFEYEEMSAPKFLDRLIANHFDDFEKIHTKSYKSNLGTHALSKDNEENFHSYIYLKVLHDLFTSQGASNCALGEIWNIPYMWHWVEPNPRHEIELLSTGKLLSDTETPKGYGRYKSFADLDRAPSIYLGDFFSTTGKFKANGCSSFSGFGWCSEREMSFVALLQIKGYEAKVKSQNGHSWTEAIVPLKNHKGKEQLFKFTIDNTFDKFSFERFSKNKLLDWKQDLGDSKTKKWYNEKAFSKAEQSAVRNIVVKKAVSRHLEKQVVKYLNRIL